MLWSQLIQLPLITLEAASTVIVFVVLPMALVVFLCFMPSVIELKRPLDCAPKLIHPTFKAAFIAKGLIPSSPIPLKPVPTLCSLFPAFIVNIEE